MGRPRPPFFLFLIYGTTRFGGLLTTALLGLVRITGLLKQPGLLIIPSEKDTAIKNVAQ